MSQAVVCSHCKKEQATLRCELCPDMAPLCQDCYQPHYRLMHHYDTHTGENIRKSPGNPKDDPEWGVDTAMAILVTQLVPRKVPKGKPTKLDRDAVQKFIKGMKSE